MRRILTIALIIIAGDFALGDDARPAPDRAADTVVAKAYESKGWLIQETGSFRIICRRDFPGALRLAEACEALRRQLQQTWLGDVASDWSPRCEIVLHPTVAGYVCELGNGSQASSGCATIDLEKGRIVKRRVDLRADADDWMNSALPHELTHVVLAEKFTTKQIPRWADEGMAILSEPVAKQALRRSAMQRALAKSPRYAAGDLLSLGDYPSGDRRDVFYGESASLVAYLIELDSPARFLEFTQLGQQQGFERALGEVYKIPSLADLDAHWRPRLTERGQSAELFAARIARITSGQVD